jgi:hypothetical protein
MQHTERKLDPEVCDDDIAMPLLCFLTLHITIVRSYINIFLSVNINSVDRELMLGVECRD